MAAVWRYAAASLLAGFGNGRHLPRHANLGFSSRALGLRWRQVIIISSAFVILYLGSRNPVALGLCASAPTCGLLRDLAPRRKPRARPQNPLESTSEPASDSRSGSGSYLARARQRLQVEATRALFRRQLAVRTPVPLISFTFDDFPRSAFLEAGSILTRYDIRGTYYVSLSLVGKQSQMGPMFQPEDLKELARSGSRTRMPHVRALPFLEHPSRHIRESNPR